MTCSRVLPSPLFPPLHPISSRRTRLLIASSVADTITRGTCKKIISLGNRRNGDHAASHKPTDANNGFARR
jgi:hypothetical protein